MPTASELVDNRAIVARIHRRRHPSEDDGDSPLMPYQDHQDHTIITITISVIFILKMEKNGWEEIVMERLSAGRWRQTVHTISMGHLLLLGKS